MNKIYKVIWSKAKHTYVVASEIAKGHTKGETTGKGLKKLAAALLVAAALMGPNFAWAADTVTVNDTKGNQQTVYTEEGAKNNFATIGNLSTVSTEVQTQATEINTNTTNINGLTTRVNALESSKTDTALHISSSGDLIVGTKENQRVKDMEIRGELTSGSISTGDITSGGDVTVTGKMAADGVTDETTKDGTYIKQNNTVGNNLVSLDTQVKANADAIAEKVNAADVYTKDETDQKVDAANTYTYRKVATEEKAREAADKALDDRITNVKEYLEKQTSDNYVSKADAAVQDGAIVKAANTIGENVTNLDAALAKETAARIGADKAQDAVIQQVNQNAANGIATLATAYNNEVASREAADNELNERITNEANGIHDEIKAGDKALDDRITNVKEYLEKQTSDTYVSKDDAAVQNGAIVKADKTIGENVTNLDAALAKETAARIGADKAQDAVIQQVNQNAANGIATLATAYNNEVASREAADNELNERITNEANAIHETTNKLQDDLNTETTAREAADTALDTRITNVKEYLEKQTSDKYVSKTDAAVQDGAIVKADKTIGENVTNLDAALTKETAARIGADKAQDEVIKQVNQNVADGFNTINTNMANGFAALNTADAAEKEARIGADKKLAEAVNSGLSLRDDNVLQKNTTTVADDGTVTTSKSDANEMILNKGNKNQITLNEKGVKVGTNSSVLDADGIYTGGDTFDVAKAAMSSDGQIKGANGKFTVDASGNTTVTSLDAGTGTIQTKGDLYAKDATFSGDITAKDATLSGDLSAKDGTFSGDLSAKDGTFSGDVSAKDVTATGTLQGAEVTDGTATLKQGKLTGVKDIETEALHVNGDANVTGKLTTKDLEVTGEFNANTLKSRLDENNYTEIHGGNVTSKNLKVDKGVTRTSESSFDENGREEYVTDNDSRATVKVGANEISQTLDDKGDTSEKQSTFRQKIDQILQEIKSANGSTSVEQTDVNITNTAANGTITNDAKALVNKASDSITSQIGDGSAVKSVMDANGIANTATGGTISNSAANISNTTTGNMTNTIGGNLIDTIMGTSTTTVNGKVTEDYKSDLSTKVGGDETHAVTGNQTTTVSGNRTVNVKGTETENFNALETNVKTHQKTSVGGNQTNIVGGDQQNTVSGSKTETVKGSVTEKYGSQATTVDGDQSTNIGGNQTTVVAKDQTNTVSGNKTETVKGAVNETYGSQTTKVNGDQSTTVTGKQTNSITGDQVNTIGGNQTTTVTGDSSLSANNITNTATKKLSNSAADIENTATNSITDKVGKNTSWKMTDGTVVESVKDASGKTNQTTTTAADTYQFVKDGDNTLAKRTSSTNDNLNITDGNNTYTKITTATGNKQTVTDGMETASTNLTKSASNTLIENGTQSVLDHMAADTSYTVMNENGNGSRQQQTASEILDRVTDGKNTSEVKMTANGITNTAEGGTIYNKSKDILNFADGEIGNSATKITNLTGDNTVTSDTNGTTFENTNKKDTVTFMDEEKSVDTKKTTISGNTITTGEAVMDYADVMKDLGVRGNATIKGDTTMKGNASVGKDLTVAGTSTLTGVVTMKSNATVEKDLTVNGKSTLKGSLEVTNGTTTDTLKVTGSSEFDGKATFNDIVTMNKGLSVTGGVTADTVTADSYKVGDKTYIDKDGINANNQVIRNVGQGDISAGSTDAVSGGQLYETNTRVSGLETRMGTVETRVDKLDNKIDKVGANAAAMANLHPLEFDEDSKWNIAAAVGSSGSETASAVGVFYRPNENVMVNVSAAMGTGENMFGGGVSLRLGHGGNKAKEAQMKAAAAENKELRAKVDDPTARMDALLSVLNPNMSKDFPDVPENHWAYEAVSRLAGNGIVEGYEDGKYHGERQMTRYEMAEIIYNALSKGAKAEKKLVEEFRPELQAMAAQKKA